MKWVLLEVLVALLLAAFIVWFTMGGKRKQSPGAADDEPGGGAPVAGQDGQEQSVNAERAGPTA